MPQITIYVDAELYERIKATGVAPSAVCQRALRKAVRARGHPFGQTASTTAKERPGYERRTSDKRRTP